MFGGLVIADVKQGQCTIVIETSIKLNTLNLWSWRTCKGHGKSHGKSWNLKRSKEYKTSNNIIMSYNYSEGNVFVNMIRLWRSSCWILCGAWHGKLEANDAWTNGWSHKVSQISFMSSLLWKYMNAMLKKYDQRQ